MKLLFLFCMLAALKAPLTTVSASEPTNICSEMSRIDRAGTQFLWLPQKDDFYGREPADAFINDRTALLFRATQPYKVPTTIDWDADPFQHSTWRLFFNSLGWVYAPLYSYVMDGNEASGIAAKAALFDWIETHINDTPNRDNIKWNDQAAAFRLANFGEFARILSPILNAEDNRLLQRAIEQHVIFLEGLFNDPQFYGNNHGFMDAMAVYSAGTEHQNEKWMKSGRDRIEVLFREMFVEGVSIEQAFGYQTYKLRLMHEANCFAVLNAHDPIATFGNTAREALEFISLVSYPDLTLPAMGDTYFRMPIRSMQRYLNDTTATPITKYIWSDGKEGEKPKIVNVRPKGGYGVFWPSKDMRIVFDFSPAATGHNHNDGLNFTLFAKGEELIVDSGGPYAYGSKERSDYFNASAAHNVVLVNGQDLSGAAKLTGHGDMPSPWMKAETVLGEVKHARTITLVNTESVIIQDDIDSRNPNTYTLLYHLPPHAKVSLGEETVINVGDASFSLSAKVGDEVIIPVIGEGWVTSYTLNKEVAPVLRFEFTGTANTVETLISITP